MTNEFIDEGSIKRNLKNLFSHELPVFSQQWWHVNGKTVNVLLGVSIGVMVLAPMAGNSIAHAFVPAPTPVPSLLPPQHFGGSNDFTAIATTPEPVENLLTQLNSVFGLLLIPLLGFAVMGGKTRGLGGMCLDVMVNLLKLVAGIFVALVPLLIELARMIALAVTALVKMAQKTEKQVEPFQQAQTNSSQKQARTGAGSSNAYDRNPDVEIVN